MTMQLGPDGVRFKHGPGNDFWAIICGFALLLGFIGGAFLLISSF